MTKYTLSHPDGTREELEEEDLIEAVNQRYRAGLTSDDLRALDLSSAGVMICVEDGRDTWSISR